MLEIPLNGARQGVDNQQRIEFLKAMLNNAELKMNHIDGLRQRNMNIAIIIFVGMYGFVLQSSLQIFHPLCFVVLTLAMFVFTLLDRRLHRFQHGWRKTRRHFVEALRDVINSPNNDVNVQRYYEEGEQEAEKFSLQPVLYYLLIITAVVSVFVRIKGS